MHITNKYDQTRLPIDSLPNENLNQFQNRIKIDFEARQRGALKGFNKKKKQNVEQAKSTSKQTINEQNESIESQTKRKGNEFNPEE